jgi:hypothetical protein
VSVPRGHLDGDACGGAGVVRGSSALGRCRQVSVPGEQPGVGAGRAEFEDERFGGSPMRVAALFRSLADVHHDHPTHDRTSRRGQFLALADHRTRGARLRRPHASQDRKRMGTDDPVGLIAHVSLELPEGGVGLRTVQAVLLARVEAERVQLALEFPHVVAAEQRGPVVQGAVAQAPSGLDELFPRVGADQPVDAQVPFALEPAHRALGGAAERAAALGGLDRGAERHQALLDVGDLVPAVTLAVDAHRATESAVPLDPTATADGRPAYDR